MNIHNLGTPCVQGCLYTRALIAAVNGVQRPILSPGFIMPSSSQFNEMSQRLSPDTLRNDNNPLKSIEFNPDDSLSNAVQVFWNYINNIADASLKEKVCRLNQDHKNLKKVQFQFVINLLDNTKPWNTIFKDTTIYAKKTILEQPQTMVKINNLFEFSECRYIDSSEEIILDKTIGISSDNSLLELCIKDRLFFNQLTSSLFNAHESFFPQPSAPPEDAGYTRPPSYEESQRIIKKTRENKGWSG